MLHQSPKYLAHQRHMRSACGGIDQNVIYIHHHTLPMQVPENLVYEGLKDGWSILQPYCMTFGGSRDNYPLLCLTVRCRAVAIPGGDATGQDALDCAAVELFENLGTHAESFQSPEGEKVLSCPLQM
jgi:hypothetical protein